MLLYAGNVLIQNAVSLPAEPVKEIRQDKHRSAAVNRRPQNDVYILQSTYNAADCSRGTNKKYLFIHNQNHIIHIYLLQLGCYPVAVVILHVNKT